MILTTTPSVEGRSIAVPLFPDLRSATYEDELMTAREQALQELEQRAAALGADAVVGIDVDYEVLGSDNGMLMVTVSGTAVTLD